MAKTQIKRGKQKWRNKPGELVYTGDISSEEVQVDVLLYSPETDEISFKKKIEEFKDYSGYRFIDVKGLNNKDEIQRIGAILGLDDLLLEDIMHMGERPRLELQKDYLFLIMKNLYLDKEKIRIVQEQLSFVVKDRTIVIFRDSDSEVINYAKEKLKNSKHSLRRFGTDYALYYIMDLVVDNYFLIVSDVEEQIEQIEEAIISGEESMNLEEVYRIRKELLLLRASIWPLEDVIHGMIREEGLIENSTKEYLRDLKGNISQIMDYTSIYRESILGLFDIYLSNTSNKMNSIMQTLTVISIMFIPSTFLAGVYGMNFKEFPELGIKHAYPVFWIINIALMIFMYRYFKNKRWL